MSQVPQAPQHTPQQPTQQPTQHTGPGTSQGSHAVQATPTTHSTHGHAGSHFGSNVTTGVPQRVSTETKSSFKTTELIAYVATVIGVLVASAIADGDTDFGPRQAWFFVTLLTIGYLVSRGLAKSGSRDFYDRDQHSSSR